MVEFGGFMSQSPHDVPTAAQLIESVREWLQNDVLAATSGRIQFHSRVRSEEHTSELQSH